LSCPLEKEDCHWRRVCIAHLIKGGRDANNKAKPEKKKNERQQNRGT